MLHPATALLKACKWLLFAFRTQRTTHMPKEPACFDPGLALQFPLVPFSCVGILLPQAHSSLLPVFALPGPELPLDCVLQLPLFLRRSSEELQGEAPGSLPTLFLPGPLPAPVFP